jgi:hypothetical protein
MHFTLRSDLWKPTYAKMVYKGKSYNTNVCNIKVFRLTR